MRFRYKTCREPVENVEISIIPSKRTTKEKGILERMIERATIGARTADALRAIGINLNLDNTKYSLSVYQN